MRKWFSERVSGEVVMRNRKNNIERPRLSRNLPILVTDIIYPLLHNILINFELRDANLFFFIMELHKIVERWTYQCLHLCMKRLDRRSPTKSWNILDICFGVFLLDYRRKSQNIASLLQNFRLSYPPLQLEESSAGGKIKGKYCICRTKNKIKIQCMFLQPNMIGTKW